MHQTPLYLNFVPVNKVFKIDAIFLQSKAKQNYSQYPQQNPCKACVIRLQIRFSPALLTNLDCTLRDFLVLLNS